MFDEIKNVKALRLSDSVSHVESSLYRGEIYKEDIVIKIFDSLDVFCDTKLCRDKMYVIDELYKNRDIIGIKELVLPRFKPIIYNGMLSVIYPYIDNINFNDIIRDNHYDVRQKVEFLKQIGLILEKMKMVREKNISIFYLGDVHESNFVLNRETNKINVVDMDSCKINGSVDSESKYLYLSSNICNYEKYRERKMKYFSVYDIDYNTDLFCYIIIILNYIFNCDMVSVGVQDFSIYMEYLNSLGVSHEFTDIISKIYSNYDNVNLYMLLDEIVFYKDSIDKNRCKLVRRFGV